ncbi:putative WD-40 repeat protein [Candidatus Promineifilum breve]|uniref:WD-40 repeat protein n=1 Tax=Candidatus Promineifilum breve TaxID=1806508 RepID=A0A160T2L5_9CHLR|nr:hypothetical protein [Candidatus Promineifilum breve]CUS04351.2 putative WD-40 repeat protein [Candidatus Promineifilum breve]
MVSKDHFSTKQLRTLRKQMVASFSLDELRDLCFDLGVRDDNLSGDTIDAKTTALLEYLNQRHLLVELITHLNFIRPNVVWPLEELSEPHEPPYKGLSYFNENDATIFFGRGKIIGELSNYLCDNNFLAVVGASGIGKTSLIRAGLIPALKKSKDYSLGSPGIDTPVGSANWMYLDITPTNNPIEHLAVALTSDLVTVTKTKKIIKELQNDPSNLQLFVLKYLRRNNRSHLFLLVDQFEELFTVCKDETQRRIFIANLLNNSMKPGSMTVVINIRADFYAHCASYPLLRRALELHQKYIGPMTEDELREAIEQPAIFSGYAFDNGLTNLLLRDVGDEPGALPLLSHALLETWKRREGHHMTLHGYLATGGVQHAIANTAEYVFEAFDSEGQSFIRQIFLQLTELGEGTQDTRRSITVEEAMTGVEKIESAQSILEDLVNARLLTMTSNRVDVAHEALIREWPRLRGWLDEDREGLLLHRQLSIAAHEWIDNDRDDAYLYQGTKLAKIEEWSVSHKQLVNDLENEFLLCSTNRSKKERLARATRLVFVIASLLILIAGSVISAAIFRRQAGELAIQNQVLQVRSLANLAVVVANRTNQTDLAALIALEALYLNTKQSTNQQDLIDSSLREIMSRPLFNREIVVPNRDSEKGLLVISPDSKFLASSGGSIYLWNTIDLLEDPIVLSVEGIRFEGVNFSSTGRYLASEGLDDTDFTRTPLDAPYDSNIYIWRLDNLDQPAYILPSHGFEISALAFDPFDRWLAVARVDETVSVWDITNLSLEPLIFKSSEDDVRGDYSEVTFSPDGRLLAVGSWDWLIRIWNIQSLSSEPILIGHGGHVTSVEFSPDGGILATANQEGIGGLNPIIRLWDVGNFHSPPFNLEGHGGDINSLSFSPDGKYLASASSDKTIRIWSMENKEAEPRILEGHSAQVRYVQYAFGGDGLISFDSQFSARFWDLTSSEAVPAVMSNLRAINAMAISSDSNLVGAASTVDIMDSTINVWNFDKSDVPPIELNVPKSQIITLALSPSGQFLAAASREQCCAEIIPPTLTIWNLNDITAPLASMKLDDEACALAFSPGEDAIVQADCFENKIRIWNINALDVPPTFLTKPAGTISHIEFTPDGNYLIASGSRQIFDNNEFGYVGVISIWDMSKPSQRATIYEFDRELIDVAINPKGAKILAAFSDGFVRSWNIGNHTQVPEVVGRVEAVDAPSDLLTIAISNNGQFLATSGQDQTINVWALDDMNAAPIVLIGHGAEITYLKFSRDDRYIISISRDRTIRRWLTPSALVDLTCSKVGRNLSKVEWELYMGDLPYHQTCPHYPIHPTLINSD